MTIEPYRSLKSREQRAAYARERDRRIYRAVIEGYGGRCVCCGESEFAFLTLDHVEGGGRTEVRKIGRRKMLLTILKQGFPEGYQILCWNCNAAKHFKGRCPHAKESVS